MFASNTSNLQEEANYIESVFSTYLYTGNGSTQTISNGIDLAGKGGLVWTKTRNVANSNWFIDTARGGTQLLRSNTTEAQFTSAGTSITFGSGSYAVGSGDLNTSTQTEVSWTFRKQPKFFDVVTYTGDGTANRNVAHSLGSAPGFVIIKRTSGSSNWCVAARLNSGDASFMMLNRTVAQTSTASSWFNGTTFKVGTSDWPSSTGSPDFFGYDTNGTGDTYVAYLFAHNAGGFGLTGTDNVISCGSYTGNGSTSGPTINLGYEPQWVLIKNATTGSTEWILLDNMRGMPVTGNSMYLRPNSSGAEGGYENFIAPTATGFQVNSNDSYINSSSNTYIYIAIRRGPMKTPTTGTSVFSPNATTASGGTPITTGMPVDFQIQAYRTATTPNNSRVMTRLTGVNSTLVYATFPYLLTSSASAESSLGNDAYTLAWGNTGFQVPAGLGGGDSVYWNFGRAPNFCDVVCYTGNDVSGTSISHNLGVVPELMIVKSRTVGSSWYVYTATTGNANTLVVNSTAASAVRNVWGNTTPTSSVFYVGATGTGTNNSGATYVAYLFASCPGVSKVGSYTGTGTTLQVDCGFTGGARFVLIKRTDSTGAWYVWDSARGIVAGNNPYLLLNSTAAEVTSTDYIDTYSAGFEISSTAPAAINASGGTFIYLAIA